MTTTMHRLQISLPEEQIEYLRQQARQEGVSIAEVIRRLVQQDVDENAKERSVESIWDIVGIIEDEKPLINGIPVSENPDLYLVEAMMASQDASEVSQKVDD